VTEYFDPPLESHERKVGPKNGEKTVNEEDGEPLIVPNNPREPDLSFTQDVNAGRN
jgi:hypothetical protein